MKFYFATCDTLPNGSEDDKHLVNQLAQRGHVVEYKIWNRDADWSKADRTLIRTTWDYQRHLDHFRKWVETTPNLFNEKQIVLGNIDKRYLAKTKYAIVTKFAADLQQLEQAINVSRGPLVIKPSVSASAELTFKATTKEEALTAGREILRQRGDVLIQPFIESIATDGEISLIYFDNTFSHAIVKRPARGDYRVQQNFGGTIEAFEPTLKQRALAEEILPKTKYARVDLVDFKTEPKVGELELIEPELFFRMNPNSAKAFANALVKL